MKLRQLLREMKLNEQIDGSKKAKKIKSLYNSFLKTIINPYFSGQISNDTKDIFYPIVPELSDKENRKRWEKESRQFEISLKNKMTDTLKMFINQLYGSLNNNEDIDDSIIDKISNFYNDIIKKLNEYEKFAKSFTPSEKRKNNYEEMMNESFRLIKKEFKVFIDSFIKILQS